LARNRSPNRDKAFEIYKENKGKISSQEIAKILDEKINNINTWRVKDKWSKRIKVGAPYGNKNAVGNKGGAKEGNQNARTNGWYSKYHPIKVINIIKEIQESGGTPLEILWAEIVTLEVNIIRAQKIMHVKNNIDHTRELKKVSVNKFGESKEWEIQFAWDKYAKFLDTQSRAMARLSSMLKQYDEMVHTNWDILTEEQKLKVELLKAQIDKEKKSEGTGSRVNVIFVRGKKEEV